MVFSSLVFLFVFLPVVLAVNFVIPKKFRNLWLLVSSLFFYFWGEKEYSYVILVSIIFNYFIALKIDSTKNKKIKKRLLTGGLVGNLLLLGFYKYFNFFIENINNLTQIFDKQIENNPIHLPIGISFFTFQAISYIVDVYRGQAKAMKSFKDVALYITLFPQLIAGPIVTFNSIKDQIKERTVSLKKFTYGLDRFLIGLAKKVLIANNVSNVADEIFGAVSQNGEVGASVAWVGVLAYAVQLYFDFSGYSDMAVGIGRMLGFNFIENFNYPYISKTIQEFWRRWNISLGAWFRDYVYIPLGGSKKSAKLTYFNLGVVFLLTGFWHGADWAFVIWGLWNGLFIILERAFLKDILASAWSGFSHIYATLVFLIGWVFFRAESLGVALDYLKSMFNFANWTLPQEALDNYLNGEEKFFLLAGLVLSTPIIKFVIDKLESKKGGWLEIASVNARRLITLSLFLISIVYLIGNTHNPFIYFRF